MELAVLFAWVSVWLVTGAAEPGRGASLLAAPGRFALETTVLVNDVARTDRELGYKIKGHLDVSPIHRQEETLLLQFQLSSPKLYLRGKHPNAQFLPHPSLWDNVDSSPFYAHWVQGAITTAYLDPQDPIDVLNYKKAVLSLFQFNSLDGEHNETDISGDCNVLYETLNEKVFRKIKKRCSGDAVAVSVRRVSRYTLATAEGPLASLHAEELVTVGEANLGLKARSWHALNAQPAAASVPALHATLDGALAALPVAVAPAPLQLAPPSAAPQFADDLDYNSTVEALRAQLEAEGRGAGAGGTASTAEGALRLAVALRAAPAAALRHLLDDPENHAILEGLVRALGLAGTRAALAALDDLVQLRTSDAPLHLATVYLEAFALAAEPEASAAREVLRVGEEAASVAVGASALLAAAAAGATLAQQGHADVSLAVKDSLLKTLARCKDEECSVVRLRALANARRADTVEVLVEHAARAHAAPSAALAALDALAAAPARSVSYAHLRRVAHLVVDERAPLEVRAAALQLVLAGWTRLPTMIARTARVLLEAKAPHELRRVFWQRVRALAVEHEEVRELLPRLHPWLRGWEALALPGTSSVLRREPGWVAGGWRAALDSAQVAQGGLLRRGQVRLLAHAPDNHTSDLVSVEMWTRGLESFAGGEEAEASEGGDAPAPSPAAGLAFAVAGVRMRGLTLFDGQAELLGHVWAGTGSTPTPALRAVVPLAGRVAWQPLGAGVAMSAGWRAAAALAIDAHAQISLWWRTAHAALELRAALVAHAQLLVRTAWGEVRADARSALEPRLHIASDADFYDAVAVCVRVHTEPHLAARNVTLHSQQGERRLRVARLRVTGVASAGRTLALGAPNDAACRTLRVAEPASAD